MNLNNTLYKRKIKNSKEISMEYIREILNKSFIYSDRFRVFNTNRNLYILSDIDTGNLVVYINNITEFIIDGNELNKVSGIIKNINFIYNKNNKKVDRIDTNITINIVGSIEGFTFYAEQMSVKDKDNQKQFILRSYISDNKNNDNIINFKNCKFFGNIGFAFTDNEIGLDNDYINLNSIIFPFTFDKGELKGKKDFSKIFQNCQFDGINQKIHYSEPGLLSIVYGMDILKDRLLEPYEINKYKDYLLYIINKIYLEKKNNLKLKCL